MVWENRLDVLVDESSQDGAVGCFCFAVVDIGVGGEGREVGAGAFKLTRRIVNNHHLVFRKSSSNEGGFAKTKRTQLQAQSQLA